ncbi:MAG: aminopeptidase P family protein [Firmicutes bacterium]|nr:aminopeptidase P family protein [Bacillota bacterium]
MELINRLRQSLQDQNLDVLLVTNVQNRAYLSGFTGSAGWLLISQDRADLLTDFRYYEQAEQQAPNFNLIKQEKNLSNTLKNELAQADFKRLGFEQEHMSYALATDLIKENSQVEFVGVSHLVETQRTVKSSEEVEKMQKAANISEACFAHILGFIRPGIKEVEVAIEMERYMRSQGAEALAFESIVASGPRSSLPHGRPTERVLEEGDFITLDFGAKYGGYCSDMTRTMVIGKASEKQKKIYNIVLEAHLKALAAVKPGPLGKDIDKIARDVISEAGYGEYFGHGLGHGVGRNVHEMPSVGQAGNMALASGHVITIEPGIYLPNWGGVRIEDMVLVTEDGYQNFNSSSKELIELEV